MSGYGEIGRMGPRIFRSGFVLIFLLLIIVPGEAQIARYSKVPQVLLNPFISLGLGADDAGAGAAAQQCPEPVSPVIDLEPVGYYIDKRATTIDPALLAENRRQVRPLNDFIAQVEAQTARMFLADGAEAAGAAACAIRLLDSWASNGALLGASNMQGNGHRRWAANALAVDFLIATSVPFREKEAVDRVRSWLARVGDLLIETIGSSKNNHRYWTAAALSATAIASGNRRHFEWALTAMSDGLDEVDMQGALPREMARGSRALSYHAFSLTPLLQVILFAKRNDVQLSEKEVSAVQRLAHFIFKNARDPSGLERKTQAVQEWDPSKTYANAWIYIYLSVFSDCELYRYIRARGVDEVYPYLGGNVVRMYPLSREKECG